MHRTIGSSLACLLTLVGVARAPAQEEAERALRDLKQRVPRFEVIQLPLIAGEVRLAAEQSLTIDDLRGVGLDDDPPVVGAPAKPYPEHQTDGFAPGMAPYCAAGVRPFRLRSFTAEFNYGGWHNFSMMEYAASHGFSVIYPYVMEDRSHFPPGTRWLRWGSFVDWRKFLASRGIPWGRFDRLADLDVVQELVESGQTWRYERDWIAMLDLEHGGPLSPEDLRRQDWYPANGTEDEKRAFERKYYQGYVLTYAAPIEALRRNGWTSVGIYPQAYGSGWYALLGLAEKGLPGLPDPATYWPWLRYGKTMYQAQEVLYPDIYVYYWSPQNVAYALARIDFDTELIRAMPERKPYRPYFWPLLHGGDADPHWWAQQPLPNEDERAMFALCFFAGCDGVVLWNWSDVGNHHVAPELWRKGATTAVGDQVVEGGVGADVMLKDGFELRPEGARPEAPPTVFRRYDVLAVTEVNAQADIVKFQHIATATQRWGPRLEEGKPSYALPIAELTPHLRPPSEAVAGAVEGLALVKPFESILRHGEVKVDVPALNQFAQTLPIVRRVKLGRYHLIATYDPLCVMGGAPREIVLRDFDGNTGLTLVLPADAQTRIFALREAPPAAPVQRQ